jgi:hypothetical protein
MNGLVGRIRGLWRKDEPRGISAKETRARRFLLDMLPKNSIGAEIGVHLGDFSAHIIDVVAPAELHLIDPWEHLTSPTYRAAWYGGRVKRGQQEMDERHAGVCARFAEEIEAGRVKVHRGYSTDVLEQFPDGYLDWVYIDGNHFYEFVRKDLELSFRKTKVGGLITGDDYAAGGAWKGGVKRAVDEFPANRPVELLELRNRQFVFRRRA